MQRRKALLALAILAVLCLGVSPVFASTILRNDYNEAHWQTYTGYADFSSSGITLVPTYTTNASKIIYYKTLQEIGYNETKLYIYYKLGDITWANENNMDRTVEFWLTDDTTEYFVGFNHYNDRYDFRLKLGSNQVYQTLENLPTEGIISIDKVTNTAMLYASNGTRITYLQYSSSGSTNPFTKIGITTFKATATIQGYAVSDTLDSVKFAKTTSTVNDAITAFIPIIVAFAMLGIVIGLMRKF